MLSNEDLSLLQNKGITPVQLEEQLRRHSTGFPYLKINSAATAGNGITVLTPEQEKEADERWARFLADGGRVYKFVPASGAASRMFKALYEFASGDRMKAPEGSAPRQLIDNIGKLPFLKELDEATRKMYSKSLDAMVEEGRDRDIVTAIIDPEGMNYGNLPKGLLKFHSYPDGSRTPVDEHLTEGAQTAASADGTVNIHFTVSAAHRRLFEEKLAKAVPEAEARTGKKFNVSLSEQKPSTDTVAANPDGTPFREDGKLLFRPGGHGALIANLGDIDSTVVFIKNIDNVVPDSLRDITVKYKTVIAGYLVQLHDKIEKFIRLIDSAAITDEELTEAISFMEKDLCISDSRLHDLSNRAALIALIRAKLDRPLRVCGMVRNEGEPGGGPFIAVNPDGSASSQILESTQIDMSRPDYVEMMNNATHFNPVDLVCYITDVDGKKYDLTRYTDPATGFISSKSSHGKELRAMELPGLWNGAMSDWNTAFVEVPARTFNPVKTVNDLLRPAHQG